MSDAEAKGPNTATTPRAPAAKPATTPSIQPEKIRRRMIWTFMASFVGAISLMVMRFFFPRALYEPNPVFSVGAPSDFNLGVDTRFQQAYRVWVVRKPDRIFVIYARCTHLGCTPDWKPSEHKFKCPCHGSGYDSDGINFEGPAPRPMDRCLVRVDPQGQIVVDSSHLFKCERGKHCEFDDPGAFIVV